MFVPFRTTICGIEELGDHCELGVTHVLSILDPGAPEPPAFGSFGEHARVELRFNDAIEELPDRVVPELQHVQEVLALGRDLTASPAMDAHLLVHCHAGVSRSTLTLEYRKAVEEQDVRLSDAQALGAQLDQVLLRLGRAESPHRLRSRDRVPGARRSYRFGADVFSDPSTSIVVVNNTDSPFRISGHITRKRPSGVVTSP